MSSTIRPKTESNDLLKTWATMEGIGAIHPDQMSRAVELLGTDIPSIPRKFDKVTNSEQTLGMSTPTRDEIDAKLSQLKAEQNAMLADMKANNAAMASKLDISIAQAAGIQASLVGQMDGIKGQIDGVKTAVTGLQTNIGLMFAFLALLIAGFQIYDSNKEKQPTQVQPIVINVPAQTPPQTEPPAVPSKK